LLRYIVCSLFILSIVEHEEKDWSCVVQETETNPSRISIHYIICLVLDSLWSYHSVEILHRRSVQNWKMRTYCYCSVFLGVSKLNKIAVSHEFPCPFMFYITLHLSFEHQHHSIVCHEQDELQREPICYSHITPATSVLIFIKLKSHRIKSLVFLPESLTSME